MPKGLYKLSSDFQTDCEMFYNYLTQETLPETFYKLQKTTSALCHQAKAKPRRPGTLSSQQIVLVSCELYQSTQISLERITLGTPCQFDILTLQK